MRRETEDFCDARLASLEGILDRTRTVVATGRARLQGANTSTPADGVAHPIDLTDQGENTPAHAASGLTYEESVEPRAAHAQPTVDLFDQDLT